MFKQIAGFLLMISLLGCADTQCFVAVRGQEAWTSKLSPCLQATLYLKGVYLGTYRDKDIILCDGSFGSVSEELQKLPYLDSVEELDSAQIKDIIPIQALVLGFINEGLVPPRDFIEISTGLLITNFYANVIVVQTKGSFGHKVIRQITTLPELKFVEPNYVYSLPGEE